VLTAEQIRDLIIDRIVSGHYPIGSRLPPVRTLADEIGAHRNTVAKAYGALEEMGLVSMRQGRGTSVVSLQSLGTQVPLANLLFKDIEKLIAHARRIGISEHRLREVLEETIAASYRRQPLPPAMVECNAEDILAAVYEVESATGVRMHSLLLDDLRADPQAATKGFSVIVTSLFHIKEVNALLQSVSSPVPVVSLYTQPDEEALRRIAEIEPSSHIGIVASNVEGARRFAAQVRAFTLADTTLLLSPTTEEIVELTERVDVIVSSRSQFERIRSMQVQIPIIELPFHVSQQSIGYLLERVHERSPARPDKQQAAASSAIPVPGNKSSQGDRSPEVPHRPYSAGPHSDREPAP